MLNHETGGVRQPITDTTNNLAALTSGEKRPKRRRIVRVNYYEIRKNTALQSLEEFVLQKEWPTVQQKLKGSSCEALEEIHKQVKRIRDREIDAEDVYEDEGKQTVHEGVKEILKNCCFEQDTTGSRNAIEKRSETEMFPGEILVTGQTIQVPASIPPTSPTSPTSPTPLISPISPLLPQSPSSWSSEFERSCEHKRRKRNNYADHFDVIADSTDDHEPTAQEKLPSVIERLHRDHSTSAITASSPTSAQEPTNTLLYQETIAQIKTVIESNGMLISEGLSHAREEYRKFVEEAARVKCELEDAEKHLKEATIEACATGKALDMVWKSTLLDKETGFSLIGMGKQAAEEAKETSTDEKLDTRRTRGKLEQSSAKLFNAMSEFLREQQDEENEKIKESIEEARRMPLESAKKAEEEVEELKRRATELERQKVEKKAILDVFSGLSDLQGKGGGEGDVLRALPCSYTWDDMGTAIGIPRSA